MDDSGGCLVMVAIVFGAIMLIMTLISIALMGIMIVGSVMGLVIAIKNYVLAIKDVATDRQKLGHYKNDAALTAVSALPSLEGQTFEDYASKSYFFGPCFEDVLKIIKYAFIRNFSFRPDFDKGDTWYGKIFAVTMEICKLIVVYGLGSIFTLFLSALLCACAAVVTCILYPIFGLVLLFEAIYFRMKKIAFRCPSCKNEYKLPIYICPDCRILHKRLKPGRYGIFKRHCLCGSVLPLSVKSKGSDTAGNVITYDQLESMCPVCGKQHTTGLTHPLGISFIGGASAGKTTFKVAFLHDFLDEEIGKYGIDYDFPGTAEEEEFKKVEAHYRGLPIPATARGADEDVSAFGFFLRNSHFSADRLVRVYDMPGEVFMQSDAQEGWASFPFSEGAVLLLDPYSITSVKAQNANEISSEMGICDVDINQLAESLINTLQQVKIKKHKGKLTIPLALVINKVDTMLLKKQCGGDAVAKLMEARPDVFTDYFVAADYICRCFLAENGGENFISNLDMNFETVHFFFSSPMGAVPKVDRVRFHPINVLPIMQWLLLRADKQLGSVWKPALPVVDLTEEQKSLYRTHREYYHDHVMMTSTQT